MYITACPLCDSTTSEPYLEVKDYLVSRALFTLVKCNSCAFIYTNPRPNEKEIARYYQSDNYYSHSRKYHGLTGLMYHTARHIMHHTKLKWLKNLVSTKGPLLDFGCGTGSFVNFLLKKDWDAWGVEPNQQAREIANQNDALHIVENLDKIPNNMFAVITLWHVLEHIHRLDEIGNRLRSTLNPGGFMIVALPNCGSYDARYYGKHWAGFDVPRHLSHFTPETMGIWIKKHELHLVKTIPLKLDAFYTSILSEKYRDGTIVNALYRAMKSNLYAGQNQSDYSSLVYVLKK